MGFRETEVRFTLARLVLNCMLVGAVLFGAAACASGTTGQGGQGGRASSGCPASYSTSKTPVGQDLTITGPSGNTHVTSGCVSKDPQTPCGIGASGYFGWHLYNPNAEPAGFDLNLSIGVSGYHGPDTYTTPYATSSLQLSKVPGTANSDQLLWSSAAGSITINADEKSGSLNLILTGNTTADLVHHLPVTTGQYHVYGAFQCTGGGVRYAGSKTTPLTIADLNGKLVAVADLTGSTVVQAQTGDVSACLHFQRPSLGTSNSTTADVGQPFGQAAAEDALETVDLFNSDQAAATYGAALVAAAHACSATSSQTIRGKTYSDSVTVSTASVTGWSGSRTVRVTTVNPHTAVAKAVDYVYELTRGSLVVELDISFNNVDPSDQSLAKAEQLVSTLLARLPS